jgi:hypothetical protein
VERRTRVLKQHLPIMFTIQEKMSNIRTCMLIYLSFYLSVGNHGLVFCTSELKLGPKIVFWTVSIYK